VGGNIALAQIQRAKTIRKQIFNGSELPNLWRIPMKKIWFSE
jgi:hypothetical protein